MAPEYKALSIPSNNHEDSILKIIEKYENYLSVTIIRILFLVIYLSPK